MKTTTKFFILDLSDNTGHPIVDADLNNRSMDVIDELDSFDSAEQAQSIIDNNDWHMCRVYIHSI